MSLSRLVGNRIVLGIRIDTWDPQRLELASALSAKSVGKQVTAVFCAWLDQSLDYGVSRAIRNPCGI